MGSGLPAAEPLLVCVLKAADVFAFAAVGLAQLACPQWRDQEGLVAEYAPHVRRHGDPHTKLAAVKLKVIGFMGH